MTSVSKPEKLKVLLVTLEFRTWVNASHWSYPINLGLEGGLDANGVEYVTIPAMHEVPSSASTSWLSLARDICAGKQFDQVWFEVSHSNLDEQFLEWLTTVAPIRIGFIIESLETDPSEWITNPGGTQRRLKAVKDRLSYLTHVIAVDEADVDKFNANGPVSAMWLPGMVPERFICEQPPPPSINCGVFYGALYGERKNWLEHGALKGLLVRPEASPEWATDLPRRFDELNLNAEQFLKSGEPFNDNFFSNYMDFLRRIRRECFALWLQGLQRGCAVVNLPQFGKMYAGRIFEGMAAGRPVIACEIPERPKTKALFEDGKEILLYSKDNPTQLASHIQRILSEPDFAQRIAANAQNKLRRFHTCERFVERILKWVKSGEDHLFKEPVNNKDVLPNKDDEIKLLEPHIVCGENLGSAAKKPMVSILMPVYNSFSYARSNLVRLLPQALDSLLAQTYQDFELLILDNQSRDETPEVCKAYAAKDLRIRYILDFKQRLPDEGVNHLASFMQGQYCMGANDDDIWHPEYIEKTVQFLEQHPDIDMVYSNAYYIDINGKVTGKIVSNPQDYYTSDASPFSNFITYIQKRNVLPIVFGMYRADIYRQLLPFKVFDVLNANVDNLFMSRFFLLGHKCHCIDECLFYYRNKHRYVDPNGDPKQCMPGLDKPLLIWIYYARHQFYFFQEVMKAVENADLTAVQKLFARCVASRSFVIHSLNLLQWIRNDVAKSPSDISLCEEIMAFFAANLGHVISAEESNLDLSENNYNDATIQNTLSNKLLELSKQRISAISEMVNYYNNLINTPTKPELVCHVESILQQEIASIERAKSQLPFRSQLQKQEKNKTLSINSDPLEQFRAAGLWSESQPLRLHLGCGEQHFDGYVNIDYPPSKHNVMQIKADIYANIAELDFPPGSVDEVRLHHVFEHFNRVTAIAMLIKWHNWLKTGGKLHIETPDLMGSAKTLLSDVPWRVKTGVVRHLAGDQAASWAYHIDHWFPERFEHTLKRLGFTSIQTRSWDWNREPYLSNVEVVATKSENFTSEKLLEIADELLWESTVSETEKPTYEVWRDQLRSLVSRNKDKALYPQSKMHIITDIAHETQKKVSFSIDETDLIKFYEENLVAPVTLEQIKIHGAIILTESGTRYQFVNGIPCFLLSLELTEHQKSELEDTIQYIQGIRQNKNPHYTSERLFEQPKICWEWAESWINSQTVTPETKIICIGGSFADDLPHVHSNYKFNIDHLAHEYKVLAPEIEYADTHYVACASETLPFRSNYADFVYIGNALDHVSNPVRTLQEIYRVLRPNGKLLIGVYYNSTFLNEHESTVVDDDFIAKCIEPMFDIEYRSIEGSSQQLTIGNAKTGFIYLVCKKRPENNLLLNEKQIRAVQEILSNFHSGFYRERRGDIATALRYYKELLHIEPIFVTDVWRILYAQIQLYASMGKEKFIPLLQAFREFAPDPIWISILDSAIQTYHLPISQTDVTYKEIANLIPMLDTPNLIEGWRVAMYLSIAAQVAGKTDKAELIAQAALESLYSSVSITQFDTLFSIDSVLRSKSTPPLGTTKLPDISGLIQAPLALTKSVSPISLDEIHDFNQRSRDRWVQAKTKTVPPGSRVLDVGAGTCPYKKLFAHCEYKTHDFKKYEGEKLGGTTKYGKIDYEADITNIPVPDSSFDVILCTEVLEHVQEPIKAIQEMSRILKPGGRLFLTAPLGSGLHQLPYHFYGGFTPEWYKYFLPKFGLQVIEITPNGGFFKLLAQECARVAWTFGSHKHLHGEHSDFVHQLFNELLPRYLFALDEKCFIDQFTVGYHVEAIKLPPEANVSEEAHLLEDLQKDFRNVQVLVRLAEIEMNRSNQKKAKNYLIAALALDPQNLTAKALWEKL